MPSDLEIVVEECRQMIQVGSKSFSAAAKIFGPEDRAGAFLLYGWCRFCDDEIDQASSQPTEVLEGKLAWLREQTEKAYGSASPDHVVFRALQHVVRRYAIPRHYPLELLEGMAMDIRRETYPDFESLLLYCYRVAGTVGLMMSHIMKVSDPGALKNACDLGIAMQLTNIARDIAEDAAMGRIYLPQDWLAQEALPPEQLLALSERPKLASLARRLVNRAEFYYRSGDHGLAYLSFRPACAIAAAREVYSEIGREVVRRGGRAWDSRVWIPGRRKIVVMFRGVFRVVRTIPRRLKNPWRPAAINLVWRHV